MVGELYGVPLIIKGFNIRSVQDVIDAERGKFSDVGISDSTTFPDETVN